MPIISYKLSIPYLPVMINDHNSDNLEIKFSLLAIIRKNTGKYSYNLHLETYIVPLFLKVGKQIM